MTYERTRSVTLVIAGSNGEIRGQLGPVTVPEPWWQEAGPVAAALPGCTVLRLLQASPDPDEPMGGQVTYLVEYDGEAALVPSDAVLSPHELRMPWAEVGGPAADLAWACAFVEPTEPPHQARAWNLSSVWRLATTSGDVWFKGVPPFMAHESAVIGLLQGHPVPTPIAADGHRQLLAAMPGRDGYRADHDEQRQMIDTLIGIQAETAARVDEFVGAGVPDLRSTELIGRLTELVDRHAPDDPALRGLIDSLPERLELVDALGPPAALVHGDAHPGNCRLGTEPPLWFDWGDSFIGSPLFDLGTVDRWPGVGVDGWLGRFDARWPERDATAAWAALRPVAALRQAWLYQHFLDHIEPSERIFHEADVPHHLAQTRALL